MFVSFNGLYRNYRNFRLVHIVVIIADCLSVDGSSILPRVAKLCSNGMGQAPGNERPILVARRGSSPLTAPSFVSVSKRMSR